MWDRYGQLEEAEAEAASFDALAEPLHEKGIDEWKVYHKYL